MFLAVWPGYAPLHSEFSASFFSGLCVEVLFHSLFLVSVVLCSCTFVCVLQGLLGQWYCSLECFCGLSYVWTWQKEER